MEGGEGVRDISWGGRVRKRGLSKARWHILCSRRVERYGLGKYNLFLDEKLCSMWLKLGIFRGKSFSTFTLSDRPVVLHFLWSKELLTELIYNLGPSERLYSCFVIIFDYINLCITNNITRTSYCQFS